MSSPLPGSISLQKKPCKRAATPPSFLKVACGRRWFWSLLPTPRRRHVVWEWHAWDHLVQDYDATKDNFGVVSDQIDKIDLNYGTQQPTQRLAPHQRH